MTIYNGEITGKNVFENETAAFIPHDKAASTITDGHSFTLSDSGITHPQQDAIASLFLHDRRSIIIPQSSLFAFFAFPVKVCGHYAFPTAGAGLSSLLFLHMASVCHAPSGLPK